MRDVGYLMQDLIEVEDPTNCSVQECSYCGGGLAPKNVKLFAGYRIEVNQNVTEGYSETVCFKCSDKLGNAFQTSWTIS